MYRFLIFLVFIGLFASFQTQSQNIDRCGTTHSIDETFMPGGASFETWLKAAQIKRKSRFVNEVEETILAIPVIVHVIHNGEEVGVSSNIPVEQIYSQIDVLNQDYRRLNLDKYLTPPAFKDVASDTRIEFIPAELDPSNQSLTEIGIHRYDGGKEEWSQSAFNNEIKPKTSWNPELYLNIWVANLQGSTLGYSTWPKEPNVPGVPGESSSRDQEGVVINSHVFGSNHTPRGTFSFLTDSRYDRGRTTTHEIGHYFGLLHTWGVSGGCQDDDYCDDTPNTRNSRDDIDFPCSYPAELNTCVTVNDMPDMFQNFMDYTADQCMNLFTKEQALRMKTVIESSPYLNTLLSSDKIKPQFAPTNLTVNQLSENVYDIEWTETSANTTTYVLERSNSFDGNYTMVAELEYGNSYYIDNVNTSGTFYYRVKAKNASGESEYSLSVSTPNIQVPTTPISLAATLIANDTIHLAWNTVDELATRFIIEASENTSTDYFSIASISAANNEFNFPFTKDNTQYYFRIKAENNGGSSSFSLPITITTNPYPPEAPTGVNVLFESANRLFQVSWNDNSVNEEGFVILRSTDSLSGYQEVGIVNANITEFIDSDYSPPAGENPYYLIRGFNKGGKSGYSEVGVFDRVTAIDDPNPEVSMLLYPNPSANHFSITGYTSFSGVGHIQISDATGKTVYQRSLTILQGEFNIPVDIHTLTTGIYIVNFVAGKDVLSQKLSVVH
ncbi:M43 family zinc metalloprotease [Flammeovirgaceae bacterium SG7u.111]|nr:M43 family zinc metalloprotease [Flammeovirgaceae bacterium SG7u.132]WPO36934.1 M43 family zinc metalloprotease [Flammeovirgaceae bacterium SG7u.111]